tara:strand:+ start:17428 stop:18813 length:1386 start_codon:yes stop_codon:yes gene_type:complete
MTNTEPEDLADDPQTDRPWELLRAALEEGNTAQLAELLEEAGAVDGLRALLQLSAAERTEVLEQIPAELAAGFIEEAPSEAAADLVEGLDVDTAASIVEELDSDVKADVIAEMGDADAGALLAELDAESAAQIRQLMSYPEDSAGGLMITEAFSFPADATVGNVLVRLASEDDEFEAYRGQHPYIVDDAGRLLGVASLRNLLTARRSSPLVDIMSSPISVAPAETLDNLIEIIEEHGFLGLPVVNDDGKLIGVVSRIDISDASLERMESESLKRQGVMGDELRSMPFFLRSRRRLSWLSVNIVLNIIAASVIAAYEDTLTAVIAIAIFLPMVSDMSGCSGNQAVAVSLRELALGLVKPVDVARVWTKEVLVGIANGIVLGILIGMVAWIWKGNAFLGVVIGLALAINTVVAVSIGGVVPLLLKRFNQDPAVASGPLLTTITDMMGFFLVLSLATLFMARLT